jgi:ATP-binding cassette subfamily C (CFTR/MRP) protein 5
VFESSTSAGLALSNIIGVAALIAGTMYPFMQSMSAFSSVERLKEYRDFEDLEDEWDKPEDRKSAHREGRQGEYEAQWPETGNIKFTGLKVRYRENLPLVLKGISFEVPEG